MRVDLPLQCFDVGLLVIVEDGDCDEDLRVEVVTHNVEVVVAECFFEGVEDDDHLLLQYFFDCVVHFRHHGVVADGKVDVVHGECHSNTELVIIYQFIFYT